MKKIVGITLGDPAGIGPEVLANSLCRSDIRKLGKFLIIGDAVVFRRYFSKNFPNCTLLDTASLLEFRPGQPTAQTAAAALAYLNEAIGLLKSNKISALVTGPLSKEATAGVLKKKFQGHTEYLAAAFGIKNFDMMFVTQKLRTVVVTRHIPIKDVPAALTPKKIFATIELTHRALQQHFKIAKPRIAVCGLNPHAGEGGKIGREELTKIIPAIQKAQRQGISAKGPFPADTIFSPEVMRNFDVIIAMYHDQGIIPVKTLCFAGSVNMTIGLPFIRTSPAHGTAFNIAGKNIADPSSMSAAINLAATLTRL